MCNFVEVLIKTYIMKALFLVVFSVVFSFVCSAQYKSSKIDALGNPNSIILKVPVFSSTNGDGWDETFKPIFSKEPKTYHIQISNPTTKEVFFDSFDYTEEWSAAEHVKQAFFVVIDYTDEFDNPFHLESTLFHWR